MVRRKTSIDNSMDIIDSRDVMERIDDLESELTAAHEEYIEGITEGQDEEDEDQGQATEALDFDDWLETRPADYSDEIDEYLALKSLQSEAEGYSEDWRYGATLIRETYFEEYARQLVEDIGDLPKDLPGYIENNINWSGVADDLKQDYTTVDFDGIDYLVR